MEPNEQGWSNQRIRDALEHDADYVGDVLYIMVSDAHATMAQMRDEYEAKLNDYQGVYLHYVDLAEKTEARIAQLERQLALLAQHDGTTGEWAPVDAVELISGREVRCDDIGLYIGTGDKLHNALAWPEIGKYRLCKRVEPAVTKGDSDVQS